MSDVQAMPYVAVYRLRFGKLFFTTSALRLAGTVDDDIVPLVDGASMDVDGTENASNARFAPAKSPRPDTEHEP